MRTQNRTQMRLALRESIIISGKRRQSGSSIAEFGAAFYAFFFAILIPTINFLGFAISYSYSYFAANLMADTVAQAMTVKRARQILDENAISLKTDSLAQLVRVQPGTDAFKLDLVRTNMRGETEIVTGRNLNVWQSEQNKSMIQYRVTANYCVKPMLDLGSVPFIKDIPIVGKESIITYKLLRGIENPDDIIN
jgi:hypothetical protein